VDNPVTLNNSVYFSVFVFTLDDLKLTKIFFQDLLRSLRTGVLGWTS